MRLEPPTTTLMDAIIGRFQFLSYFVFYDALPATYEVDSYSSPLVSLPPHIVFHCCSICGRRCTSESCSKTNENDVNDIVPSSDAKNQATSSSPQNADETPIEAETEDSSDLGRVGATPELLGSYAFAFVAALISLLGSSLLCFAKKLTSRKKTLRKGAQSSATTPSREVRHSGRIDLSDRACTPRPGLARTPVTETPTRRSRISTRRKNHDEKDIIASTVKLEVRTRKGRWVEARRSGRILNYGSPMKATKRE